LFLAFASEFIDFNVLKVTLLVHELIITIFLFKLFTLIIIILFILFYWLSLTDKGPDRKLALMAGIILILTYAQIATDMVAAEDPKSLVGLNVLANCAEYSPGIPING
jgi:hypothetical protein